MAAACTDPVALTRDVDRAIQTERLGYTLSVLDRGEVELDISWTFENRTSAVVFVPNCDGITAPIIEKLVDHEWVTWWVPIAPLCLSPVIEIPKGWIR